MSSSVNHLGETFVVFHIAKAFERVFYKVFPSSLLSSGFYLSLCTLISSFLSDPSISAVIDGLCSTPKPINNGVPQGSVFLSPTLFLFFMNDLNTTRCAVHSYASFYYALIHLFQVKTFPAGFA